MTGWICPVCSKGCAPGLSQCPCNPIPKYPVAQEQSHKTFHAYRISEYWGAVNDAVDALVATIPAMSGMSGLEHHEYMLRLSALRTVLRNVRDLTTPMFAEVGNERS